MKKLIIVGIGLFFASAVQSQQISMYSQYMFNQFAINPAVSGSESYAPIALSFRRQWAGMKDAPVTQTLSGHTFIGESMGMGLNIYNDVSGPTRRTGLNAAYSYHIETGARSKLSFGLAAQLTQFILNRDKLITEIPNDVAIMNQTSNELVPDFTFGLYWSVGVEFSRLLAPEDLRAAVMGFFSGMNSLGAFLGAICGGRVYDRVGGGGLFFIAAVGNTILSIVFALKMTFGKRVVPTTNSVVDNIVEIDMSGFVRLENPPSSSFNDSDFRETERDAPGIDRSIDSI